MASPLLLLVDSNIRYLESVVINDFYTKTGALEGAKQLLTQLAAFTTVLDNF